MLQKVPLSLFDSYRQQVYSHYPYTWINSPSFISLEPSAFLFEGNLWECLDIGSVTCRHIILTRTMLISTSIASATDNIFEGLKVRRSRNYYMYLINPRVKKFKANDTYGFTLASGPKVLVKFLCESKEEMLTWFEHLKEVCVLEKLDSEYTLGDIIGSGSSACVKIGKNKRSKQEFAIKSVPKAKLKDKPYALVLYKVL